VGSSVARTPQAVRPTVDYSYVRRDLQRIAILAGIMLVVLFGLTFVLK